MTTALSFLAAREFARVNTISQPHSGWQIPRSILTSLGDSTSSADDDEDTSDIETGRPPSPAWSFSTHDDEPQDLDDEDSDAGSDIDLDATDTLPAADNMRSFENAGTYFIAQDEIEVPHGELFASLSWLYPASELNPSAYLSVLPTETDHRTGSSTLKNTIAWCFYPEESTLPFELTSNLFVDDPSVTDLRSGSSSAKDSLAWIRAAERRPYCPVPSFWIDYEPYLDEENCENDHDEDLDALEFSFLEIDLSIEQHVYYDFQFELFGQRFELEHIKEFAREWTALGSAFEEWGWPRYQIEVAFEEADHCNTIVALLEPFFCRELQVPEEVYRILESLGGMPYSPSASVQEEVELAEE